MDAEDFYESQRLKEEEMADKFDERKAHEMAFYAKEITSIFEDFLSPGGGSHRGLRLPIVSSIGGVDRVLYQMSVAEAISDAVSLDGDPMRFLLDTIRTGDPGLKRFKDACIQAYLNEHLDDLAGCEIERQDREGME